MMELKQLAESITMVAFKKKIKNKDEVQFKNRPKLWAERIERQKEESKTLRVVQISKVKGQGPLNEQWRVNG